MQITPWENYAKAISPDGHYVATFDDADEIAMGGPTRGTLTVHAINSADPLVILTNAGSAFVWSSDSKAIAVPRWTATRKQQICVLWVPGGEIDQWEPEYSVLQLESFIDYRIVGVDSPIYHPIRVTLQFTP